MFEICDPLEVRDYGNLKLVMLDEFSRECVEKISDHVIENDWDFWVFVKEGKEMIVGSVNGPYDLVIPYNMEIREMLNEVHKLAMKEPKNLEAVYYAFKSEEADLKELYEALPSDVMAKVFALNMYFKLNNDYFEKAMKGE